MRSLLRKIVKQLLAARGLTITRMGGTSSRFSVGYISAKETVSAAEAAGLSVCDYVENLFGQQGETQKVIDQMASSGAFSTANPYVVEIGPGTGRYLEKILRRCNPARYEIYETATDWAEWLQAKYPVISHEADGLTLKQTPATSIDLVHAHGVFTYLPFLASYGYWKEMWRITKERGVIAFDIFSDECLDEQTVEKWLNSEQRHPCHLSKPYVVSIFGSHGFSLVSQFLRRNGPGHSEYLVFIRNKSAPAGKAWMG